MLLFFPFFLFATFCTVLYNSVYFVGSLLWLYQSNLEFHCLSIKTNDIAQQI